MATVIGLTGYAGAGKSLAAQHLVEKHGFIRMAFADELKAAVRRLDPILRRGDIGGNAYLSSLMYQPWGYKSEAELKVSPWGTNYREVLQRFGTEAIRTIDPDFWVRALHIRVKDAPKSARIVIDDVRMPNEAEYVQAFGGDGRLWRIERPGVGAVNGHSSERPLDLPCDRVFWNSNTPEDLYAKLDDVLAGLA